MYTYIHIHITVYYSMAKFVHNSPALKSFGGEWHTVVDDTSRMK